MWHLSPQHTYPLNSPGISLTGLHIFDTSGYIDKQTAMKQKSRKQRGGNYKYKYNFDIFLKEDALSYYLLGVYMTDGNIKINKFRTNSGQIRLTSKDIDWLSSIKNMICPELPITPTNGAYMLVINSKNLVEWFVNKGCVPNKSLILEFPNVPSQYLPDFIRGCIDGDGCIYIGKSLTDGKYYDQYNVNLVGGSKKFFTTLNIILTKLEFKFSFSKSKSKTHTDKKTGKPIISKHWCYRTALFGQNAFNFLKWIYYTDDLFCLQRKRAKANQIFNLLKDGTKKFNYNWDKIDLVKELSSKSVIALSKEMGCDTQTIYDRLHKLGLSAPSKWKK